jgi:hypothetical protein
MIDFKSRMRASLWAVAEMCPQNEWFQELNEGILVDGGRNVPSK